MDPAQAVERILEAKGMILDENRELERQYAIFKKVRRQTTKSPFETSVIWKKHINISVSVLSLFL